MRSCVGMCVALWAFISAVTITASKSSVVNSQPGIRRRDDLYTKFKKTGDQVLRHKFISLCKNIKHKINVSYNCYLEGLLGLNDENSVCDNKKLFFFLKSSKQDQICTPPLQHGSRLVTETSEKAEIHNQQFQSIFTTMEPLSLSRLCTTKLQDMADNGTMRYEAVPVGMLNSIPVMEDNSISVSGILKRLCHLKPNKAVGPDRLKPVLLKELREEIAPIIQIIFERSIRQASSQQTGAEPKLHQSLKRVKSRQLLLTTDQYP